MDRQTDKQCNIINSLTKIIHVINITTLTKQILSFVLKPKQERKTDSNSTNMTDASKF